MADIAKHNEQTFVIMNYVFLNNVYVEGYEGCLHQNSNGGRVAVIAQVMKSSRVDRVVQLT